MVCCSEPLFVFTVFSLLKPQVAEGQMRIGRPRQLYVGPAQRHWKDTKVLVLGYRFGGNNKKSTERKTGWCHVVTTQIATRQKWHVVCMCFCGYISFNTCFFLVGMFFFGRGWIFFVEGDDFYVNGCLRWKLWYRSCFVYPFGEKVTWWS